MISQESFSIGQENMTTNTETSEWAPPMPPTDLIFDDGEPLESHRHCLAMHVLIRSLNHGWADRQNFFAGGNMFVYYSSRQVKHRDFRGPDFFAVLNVDGTTSRQGWVVWEEDGRYPDVIVEFLSDSTASQDRGPKKDLYEQVFRTQDYFIYDPFDPTSFRGWRLDGNQRYQALVPNERGWLWSETLGFWLGSWTGTYIREQAEWLRFYDPEGNLVLLPEEDAQHQAEIAQHQAEVAQQQADEMLRRVDDLHQELTAKQQQSERLAARLRALGEDPNSL